MKCEGSCLDVYGNHEPPVVPVVVTGATFGGMRFNFCENAIKLAKQAGGIVVRESTVIAKLKKMMKEFDWYFEMSDDPNVWERGKKQEQEITRYVAKFPFLLDIYIKEYNKVFKDESK